MTTTQVQEPAIRVHGLEKSYKELEVLRGVDFEVERGTIFALLGSNGAGKTTSCGSCRPCSRPTRERRRSTASTSPPNRRTCGSPSASRVSSPPSTRSSAAGRTSCWSPSCGTSRTRHDRRRPARAVRPHRRGDAEGRDVLRRYASPARHRHEPHREPTGRLPGRADDRARPAGAPRGVAGGQGARPTGHDGAAHDAVPRRGRTARRPDRDPASGADHRERDPRRAQAAPPARPCRASRSSRPSRTSSSPSSARTSHEPEEQR